MEDPVFGARVDADLLHAGAYRRHPLPVAGLESLLNPAELEADIFFAPGQETLERPRETSPARIAAYPLTTIIQILIY
jgi:hypothetical protein